MFVFTDAVNRINRPLVVKLPPFIIKYEESGKSDMQIVVTCILRMEPAKRKTYQTGIKY